LHAKEALRLFRHVNVLVDDIRLLPCGYLLDLTTGIASSLRPASIPHSPIGFTAILDEMAAHPQLTLNRLMRSETGAFGALGEGVKRSAHWAELATEASDYGQQFLMQWLAMECLSRESVNEVLDAKFVTASGFPRGNYFLSLPLRERQLLQAVPNKDPWESLITRLFAKLRLIRNQIAHSGYRELDLMDSLSSDQRRNTQRLLPLCIGRLQQLAVNGIASGMTTITEMWSAYGELALLDRTISLAHELEHTTLHRLNEADED